jgi:hypothetical protein
MLYFAGDFSIIFRMVIALRIKTVAKEENNCGQQKVFALMIT